LFSIINSIRDSFTSFTSSAWITLKINCGLHFEIS
jgi:hypothetical protein